MLGLKIKQFNKIATVGIRYCNAYSAVPLLYILSCLANDEWIRKVFRWKLIVFTGIDGSGKSTYTKILFQKINSLGIDVVYYH